MENLGEAACGQKRSVNLFAYLGDRYHCSEALPCLSSTSRGANQLRYSKSQAAVFALSLRCGSLAEVAKVWIVEDALRHVQL